MNSRGNYYSREHLFLDPNNSSSGFWDFSWCDMKGEICLLTIFIDFGNFRNRFEMGIYDQPASINYVLKQTNNEKLYYVGHSQGTTALMCLLSEKPEYNDKIHVAVLLAPVGYNKYVDIYKIVYYKDPVLMVIQNEKSKYFKFY